MDQRRTGIIVPVRHADDTIHYGCSMYCRALTVEINYRIASMGIGEKVRIAFERNYPRKMDIIRTMARVNGYDVNVTKDRVRKQYVCERVG